MRIVITGATGFLGQAAARAFQLEGHEVVALGRNTAIGTALAKDGIDFRVAALEDQHLLEDAFEGAQAVVHSAALSSPWGALRDFERVNVQGTRNVLNAALRKKVARVIHISTPSIYVDRRSRENIRETDPLPRRPINHYARTKREAETWVDAAHASGLGTITLRPQGIFGPGDTSILPRLVRVARRGVIPLIGDGKNRIDMTYVDNVVEAIRCALLAPDAALGKKFNITNGEPVENYPTLLGLLKELGYTVRTRPLPFGLAYGLAASLEAFHRAFLPMSREPLLTRYSVCALALTRTLNIDSARELLGYRPRVSMQEGLARAARWWKEAHGSPTPLS